MDAPGGAPQDIAIDHIEVRVLPLPSPSRKDPAKDLAKDSAASLFRFAPPFGLRQS